MERNDGHARARRSKEVAAPRSPEVAHLRQLIALDRLLRSDSGNRRELAARLAERTGLPVSERSVSRYLDELADLWGLHAEYDRGARRYAYRDPRKRLPVGLFLSTDAWLMAEWLASVVGADPTVPRKLRDALAQLRGAGAEAPLPASFRTLPRPVRLRRAGGVLDAVETWWIATQEGRVLAFDYPTRDDDGAMRPREVEPHGIAFVDGWFQLDGWDRTRGDWRTYLPSRMRRLHETGERFERRTWKPDELFRGAFRRKRGTGDHVVVVDLTARVAFLVRDLEQHPSQRIVETRRDGSVRVEFRLSYLYEVLNWVLSLGDQARVIGPPELVELVRDAVRGMSKAYGLST